MAKKLPKPKRKRQSGQVSVVWQLISREVQHHNDGTATITETYGQKPCTYSTKPMIAEDK